MNEEELDRDEDAPSPSLLHLAEEYLNNEMDDDAAEAFEKRLAVDEEAREALIQALTIRGLVDLAFERIGQAHEHDGDDSGEDPEQQEDDAQTTSPAAKAEKAAACRSYRVLMPAYRRGTLSAKDIGGLSRHMEGCPRCAGWYEAFDKAVPRRRRVPSWVRAAALVIFGGAVFGPLCWLLAPRERGSNHAPGPAYDLIWPSAPFQEEEMKRIGEILVDVNPAADDERLSGVVARLGADNPGYFDAMARHPLVAEALRTATVDEGNRALRDQIVFLVLFLHDTRLRASERKESIESLVTRMPGDSGRNFLRHQVLDAVEVPILKEALDLIHMRGWQAEDARVIQAIEQRALCSGDPQVVECLLYGLAEVDPARARAVAMDVLRGAYGDFPGTSFPQAAQQLVAACERLATPDRNRDLRLVIETPGTPAPALAQVYLKLWKESRDPRWREMLFGLADNPDWRARKSVVSLEPSEYGDGDLRLLESLAADQVERVHNLARTILDHLKKRD